MFDSEDGGHSRITKTLGVLLCSLIAWAIGVAILLICLSVFTYILHVIGIA